jgi:nucleotide-binding universal stress UspA family protein
MRTILHPTDFSELSNKVLQAALARAKADGARLILLNVHEPQETIEGEFGMPPPAPEPSDEELLANLKSLVSGAEGVQVDALVVRGQAANEIVRVAKERRCDLIMLASHGHTGVLARLFHASVADAVKKHAGCEVIALTQAELADAAVAP